MKSPIYYTIIGMLFFSSCGSGSLSDVQNANEVVENSIDKTKDEETSQLIATLLNDKHITDSLSQRIEQIGSTTLSAGRDTIISVCADFVSYTRNLYLQLEGAHKSSALASERKLMHPRFVNKIFIEGGEAFVLKNKIQELIDKLLAVTEQCNMNINSEDLPIQLNLNIGNEDQTWEDAIFKDMPAGAVLPIINKYKRDATLTKLFLLEEMQKSSN